MSILDFNTVEEVKARLEWVEQFPFNFDAARQLKYYIMFFDSLHAEAEEKWKAFGKYMNLPE